jgi:hypothetical protein
VGELEISKLRDPSESYFFGRISGVKNYKPNPFVNGTSLNTQANYHKVRIIFIGKKTANSILSFFLFKFSKTTFFCPRIKNCSNLYPQSRRSGGRCPALDSVVDCTIVNVFRNTSKPLVYVKLVRTMVKSLLKTCDNSIKQEIDAMLDNVWKLIKCQDVLPDHITGFPENQQLG